MTKQTIIPPLAATNGPVLYGGFMDRFIALLIDLIFISIVQLLFIFPLTDLFVSATGIHSAFFVTSATMDASLLSTSTLLYWLYFAGCESSAYGATLGKRMMNLRVVDEDGLQVRFAYASLRFFGKYISAFILMVGFIMQLFTFKRQALHDMMAHTMVLSVLIKEKSV